MASFLQFAVLYLISCNVLFMLSESQTESMTRSSGRGSRGSPSPRSSPSPVPVPEKKAKTIVVGVQRDATTGLPWAYVNKRIPVVLDLNGDHVWINCDAHYQNYNSPTYQAPVCHSAQCARANSHTCHTCLSSARPGCHNNTCELMSSNPITQQNALGELAQDVLDLPSLGSSWLTVPHFLFSCASPSLAQKGLPANVKGIAGLGHGRISLINQLASYFGFQHQFTTCLSRDSTKKGALIFGDNNNLPNNKHLSIFRDMAYTQMFISQQGEYYVVLSAIRVNHREVYPSSSLSSQLTAESGSSSVGGIGDTLITTTSPYMVLHHTIFENLKHVYSSQVAWNSQVNPVGPFGICFDSKKVNPSAAPGLELVMEGQHPELVWNITGQNLMVQAAPGVVCLGVVDGGLRPKAPISIGARQLEETLVVFDLARSRLGFSTSSLQWQRNTCADLFRFDP